jgi:hypothetical protein
MNDRITQTNHSNYLKYSKYKAKYLELKDKMKQRGGTRKGLIVQAPMGSGKSYYIQNRVPEQYRDQVLDGDALLESLQIKNRNFYWYDSTKEAERQLILKAFQNALNENSSIILYSGSPTLIPTDVLVLPDSKIRWERLQSRSDFRPSRKQFDREQRAYEEARGSVPIVFNSDLPDFEVLRAIRDS